MSDARLQPSSKCCKSVIRYVDISRPLGKSKTPINILIIWCQKCGCVLDGDGYPQPHALKIHTI